MLLQKNTDTSSIQKSNSQIPARLIFQAGNESAPRAPESFTGNETQSDQDAINEVAPQSPSQIMSSAIGRAATVQTRYQQSTQTLANLVKSDPLLNPNLSTPNGQNSLPT